MLQILFGTEYPKQHTFSLRFTGISTADTGILDIFHTPSFHALKYKYTAMPAPLPKASKKVLLQTSSPDKEQMTENMKLFTGGYCESSFPACISCDDVLTELNVFSYFCLLSMTNDT